MLRCVFKAQWVKDIIEIVYHDSSLHLQLCTLLNVSEKLSLPFSPLNPQQPYSQIQSFSFAL